MKVNLTFLIQGINLFLTIHIIKKLFFDYVVAHSQEEEKKHQVLQKALQVSEEMLQQALAKQKKTRRESVDYFCEELVKTKKLQPTSFGFDRGISFQNTLQLKKIVQLTSLEVNEEKLNTNVVGQIKKWANK